MQFDIVQVRMIGGARRVLQIMVEPQDHGRGMTVDDCAELSHAISAVLDVHDPLPGAFTLEVSSPGIDRPLVRPEDYDRFAGHLAKIELDRPLNAPARHPTDIEATEVQDNPGERAPGGQRRFQAILVGRAGENTGETIRLELDGKAIEVEFARIRKAKLVLTKTLIDASRPAGGRQNADTQAGGDPGDTTAQLSGDS